MSLLKTPGMLKQPCLSRHIGPGECPRECARKSGCVRECPGECVRGPLGPTSQRVSKRCPKSVSGVSRRCPGHSGDTLGTPLGALWGPGPKGPQRHSPGHSLGHPDFRDTLGHSPKRPVGGWGCLIEVCWSLLAGNFLARCLATGESSGIATMGLPPLVAPLAYRAHAQGVVLHKGSCFCLLSTICQEWPRQTKPKKGQFMNFSQGHSGTKVQCESPSKTQKLVLTDPAFIVLQFESRDWR